MKASARQPDLFVGQPDLFGTDPKSDYPHAALSRMRMRETIDRLRAATVPFWTDEMGVILSDGAFKRAMWLVPTEEGEALWAEYDAQMERLYAIWAKDAPLPQG